MVAKFKKKDVFLRILTGSVAGICNGLLGGGGGMIVVPMLTYVLKKENHVSHATAILIILPMSIISGVLYLILGSFDFETGLPTTLGVIVGGVVGAFLLKKISSKGLTILFSVVMMTAGVKMLFF